MAPRKPGERPATDPSLAAPRRKQDADVLILNFQDSEKINLCRFGHLVRGALFWQPRPTHASILSSLCPPTLRGEGLRTSSSHAGTLGRTPSPAAAADGSDATSQGTLSPNRAAELLPDSCSSDAAREQMTGAQSHESRGTRFPAVDDVDRCALQTRPSGLPLPAPQ